MRKHQPGQTAPTPRAAHRASTLAGRFFATGASEPGPHARASLAPRPAEPAPNVCAPLTPRAAESGLPPRPSLATRFARFGRSAHARPPSSLLAPAKALAPRSISAIAAISVTLGLAAAPPARALDRSAFSMEILLDDRPIEEMAHEGTIYVEAARGREYSVRLRNGSGERIAVALSVDGLNSIDARTTSAAGASKWILGPWETITIDGWQTSSNRARHFFFTSETKSYGAWLGSTKNLGVITAAVFRERCAKPIPYSRRDPAREGWWRDSPSGLDRPLDQDAPYPGSARESDRPAAAPREANDGAGGGGERGGGGSGADEGGADPAEAGSPSPETSARTQASTAGRDARGEERESGEKDLRATSQGSSAGSSDALGKSEAGKSRSRLSNELAATGIGREIGHEVRRIEFDAEPEPAAVLTVRYEYRDALVRLGVLPRPCCDAGDPLARRERARGFDNEGFAPDPYSRRRH